MVRNIYILWDMVFVICIGIICKYFVGYGSCICILCETWSLSYMRSVYGYFVGNVFVKHMEVWERWVMDNGML